MRTIYDYRQPIDSRKIYYGLVLEETNTLDFTRNIDWLLDPLNPHAVAATRPLAYTEFTLMTLMRCLLAYADSEYTLDTTESVPRAKVLYETVLELCETLPKGTSDCPDIIGTLPVSVGDDYYDQVWQDIQEEIYELGDGDIAREVMVQALGVLGQQSLTIEAKLTAIQGIVSQAQDRIRPDTIQEKLDKNKAFYQNAISSLAYQQEVGDMIVSLSNNVSQQQSSTQASNANARISGRGVTIPFDGEMTPYTPGHYVDVLVTAPNFEFCIPSNPVPKALCMQAALNLFKIRNCMNIAGVVRELEPYAGSIDTTSGLPQIGEGGNLILPGAYQITPSQYRYPVLIEKAKQLVSIAQQIENAFLSALEKRDAEYYNLMKAKQDLSLAKASIQLQKLRVKEAEGGITLAELQKERAGLQVEGLQEMIDAGLNEWENSMIDAYYTASSARISAAYLQSAFSILSLASSGTEGAIAAASIGGILSMANFFANATAISAETSVQINSLLSSFARHKQEWEFQKSLAQQDVKIGDQQIKLAEDRVRVVGQEKVISEMQADFAQVTVDFLNNKFTNVELYDWMSGVLEEVYSYFLQQATAMAHLAANQLAFERQEVPPPYILNDYWQAPTDNAVVGTIGGNEVDRRGLTGSSRLLQDIYQLDQFGFDTNKRKLQLTKTISLSSIAPIEFQQFKETGVMTFYLPMSMFDWDFPGHYLRLIKRVRTSVIALIPPLDGIKATLTNTGLSRVVIGGSVYQEVIIRRQPESIALTSPRDATGMFELQPENEFFNPFESTGVDSFWEFRMEKAGNLFDYSTIADVIITLEYTALNSFDYSRQVKNLLNQDRFVSAMRAYSFKNEFADQWYDLHHPEAPANPEALANLKVSFQTGRADFPPNISALKIKAVSFYFSLKQEVPAEQVLIVNSLTINNGQGSDTTVGQSDAKDINRLIKLPLSAQIDVLQKQIWTLTIHDVETMHLFENEQVEDILFVIEFEGERVAWL